MSIFGYKEYRTNTLQNKLKELTINISNLQKRKRYITVTAERRGPLKKDDVFAFGDGCKNENGLGYVMMTDGYIEKMSRISNIHIGALDLCLFKNGREILGCKTMRDVDPNCTSIETDCDTDFVFTEQPYTPFFHPWNTMIKTFTHPYIVRSGDVLNFICTKSNPSAKCTIASLLINIAEIPK